MTTKNKSTTDNQPMAGFSDGLYSAAIDLTRALLRRAGAVEFPDREVTKPASVEAAEQRYQELVEQAGQLQPYERDALDVIQWIASIFAEGREPLPEEVEVLARMANAHRPTIEGERQARALELVEDHAERVRTALTSGESYRGNTPGAIAEQLAVALMGSVHTGFEALYSKSDEVAALLARYEPDQHRHRVPKGQPSKLGATGILKQLWELAGKPQLHTFSFSERGAANARRRHSK